MRIKAFFIRVENKRLSEMGLNEKYWEEPVAIDMDRVESIWRNIHDDDETEGTTIVMQSGHDYTVLTPYNDVLKIWINE